MVGGLDEETQEGAEKENVQTHLWQDEATRYDIQAPQEVSHLERVASKHLSAKRSMEDKCQLDYAAFGMARSQ